ARAGPRAIGPPTPAARARPSATRLSVPASSCSFRTRSKTSWSSGGSSRAITFLLERSRDPAVLAAPPGGDREEQHQHERQGQHVQDVPAQQRLRADDDAAQEEEVR